MEFVYWRILGTIDYYGFMDVGDVKERENDVFRWLNYRRFYHAREMGDKWTREQQLETLWTH